LRQLKVAKLPLDVWQLAQAVRCGPEVIGNRWVKAPCVHDVSVFLWQLSHVAGNPADRWFGLLVRS
jgi:hypothetical protein